MLIGWTSPILWFIIHMHTREKGIHSLHNYVINRTVFMVIHRFQLSFLFGTWKTLFFCMIWKPCQYLANNIQRIRFSLQRPVLEICRVSYYIWIWNNSLTSETCTVIIGTYWWQQCQMLNLLQMYIWTISCTSFGDWD